MPGHREVRRGKGRLKRPLRSKETLRGLDDFRRLYFPKSHERAIGKEFNKPNAYGANLAVDLLRRIRQRMTKAQP